MNKKERNIILLASLLLLCFGVFSLFVGRFPLVAVEILDPDTLSHQVFFKLRLPRTVVALLSGFSLGLSGAVFQTVFRNHLASPDVIGVASGANMGAAIAILLTGGALFSVSLFALLGGMFSVCIVFLIASTAQQEDTASFVVAGVVVNAITQAIIMMLKMVADPERQLAAMEYWAMGSLASITAEKLLWSVPLMLFGCGAMLFMRWRILMLSLSDQEAMALGMSPLRDRIAVLFFATLAVAAGVSVTGLISFVGLIAPLIARLVLKGGEQHILFLSPLLGGCILTFSDCMARLISQNEVPISVLTSLIGAPALIFILFRRKQVTHR